MSILFHVVSSHSAPNRPAFSANPGLLLSAFFAVSKTTEELRLEWKSVNPVLMGRGLRMPQFEIVKIEASDCQESFQIGS